ncbi:site-specific integrase [Tichowtungia aerotolerans]|uniref:Tyrosine-type recombinase/integrase n=1 Tax=Tichowtungia aerotolerans TaxID=2697043 RepID=A0A6P1M774_9BACT|nr:tyrosine-type recombinase/integrase [Tichowtungia aerotolerans]QHI68424.1 tyrosine-type recombinase/integrase [Tichowtungia aerotolerans]
MKKATDATFKEDKFEIHHGFRIRLIETTAGKRYQVDLGRKSGKHVRKTCKTKDAAIGWAQKKSIEAGNKGIAALRFSDEQKTDAVEALFLLKEYGVNLRAAAKFYIKHHQKVDSSNGFGPLVEQYIQKKERDMKRGDLRPRSFSEIKKWLKPCKEAFEHMAVDAVEPKDIDVFLDEQGIQGTSRANLKRYLGGFYNWAMREGKATANPVKRTRQTVMESHTPGIYTPKEVKAIFKQAEELHPDLVPYLALAFFAGVRPEEITRLGWKDVDLNLGEIHIRADQSKTRSARIVTMPENLKAWLLKYRKKDGKIFPYSATTLKRWRVKVYQKAEAPSIQDGARHTFATFCFALEGLDETLHRLGHTDSKMLQRHYKGLAKNRKAQAQSYFQIKPATAGKVVQIKKSKAA